MDEKQLSIEQVMEIMGWSYPTARNFAVKHGELTGNKWHVPSSKVWKEVAKLEEKTFNTIESFFKEVPDSRPEPAA